MRSYPIVLAVTLGLLAGSVHARPSQVTEVTVKGARVRVGDLVSGLPAEAATADLGATPAYTGTRVITRAEVTAAMHERGVDSGGALPDAFRVRRQLRVLSASDIAQLVTDAVESKLPRGVRLSAVKAPQTARIPDGWTDVRADLPRPPHRVGSVSSAVTLSFFEGQQALWVLSIPVDLTLSQEATPYDVPRGTHVTFVIRRGLIEVRSAGTVTIDADVGSVAPVTVMPSGRSLPARLEDSTTAVMLDTP